MLQTGYFDQPLPFGALVVLRRVSAAVVAVVSLRLCMWFYGVDVRESHEALMIILALLALLLFPGGQSTDIYATRRFWSTAISVFLRSMVLFTILLIMAYATKTSSIYSRKLLFTWIVLTPPLLTIAQFMLDGIIWRVAVTSNRARKFVVAGGSELGQSLAKKIEDSPQLSMMLDGFFDDRSVERLGNGDSVQKLGNLKDLPDYIREHNIDLIFIVIPLRNIQRVTELLDQLHDTTASIYFVPDVFVFDLIQCRTSDIDGMPVVALCETPFYGSRGMIKKISDYVIASTVLLLTSPLFIIIAICVKLSMPGSAIFKQRRYGLDGREITVYKFRTMTVSEDSDVVRQATRDDERITKLGAFLRKYSLDELPQLINVLQGRMSVVGPRPHAVAHNEEYRGLIKGYMVRHKVNPGITGLAQIRGFRGETNTVEDMRKRVECDLEYLRNWSLSLDFRILFKTISTVLSDKMAY